MTYGKAPWAADSHEKERNCAVNAFFALERLTFFPRSDTIKYMRLFAGMERKDFMKAAKDSKSFYKLVFSLVVPMALQNLINVAVTSADVVMLGRVGETVLSGSSLAGQVQFILTLIFFGLTSGAAVLTAQYWGKGDTRTIEKVMGIAMRFSLIAGGLFTLAVLLFPHQAMRIFTPDEAVIDQGVKYLRIVALSYLPISISIVYLNIMRSVERVVISTIVYLTSLLVNIGINAVLIFGLLGFPAMGIEGAAVGTLIARLVELAIVVVYAKCNKVIHFKPRDILVRDPALFHDFLRYSIPVTLNELMWGAGSSMNAVVIGHLGSSAVAANSVAQVMRQLATVIAFGIANAAAILIGKAIGEERYDTAKEYSKRLVKVTLLAGLGGAGFPTGVKLQAHCYGCDEPDPHSRRLFVGDDVRYVLFCGVPGI